MANSTTKTRGVVLSTIPYNDRTQFVHIYTERLGKVTCKITISRVRRSSGQRMFFAPLSVLDLVLSGNNSQELMSIQEASLLLSPYTLSMTDPAKSAQCMYMAELIDKTVKEVEPNERLWNFISQSIELLQLSDKGSANFHLVFTTRFSYHLGFHVDNSVWEPNMQFDISEGCFTHQPIYHPFYLTADSASWLHELLKTDFSHLADLRLTRDQRNILLDMMLTFLRIHMPEIGDLRTVNVLKELFA